MAAGRLAGKVAIVTGSSSGIGQGILLRFASEGADVVVDVRNDPSEGEETQARAAAFGVRAIVIRADVAKTADTQNLVDETWKQLGAATSW